MIQGVTHEGRADATTTKGSFHEHHRHPGHVAENDGACRAHRLLLPFGHEAAVGLHDEETPPIRFELIPAVLLLEAHAQGQVGGRHGTYVEG